MYIVRCYSEIEEKFYVCKAEVENIEKDEEIIIANTSTGTYIKAKFIDYVDKYDKRTSRIEPTYYCFTEDKSIKTIKLIANAFYLITDDAEIVYEKVKEWYTMYPLDSEQHILDSINIFSSKDNAYDWIIENHCSIKDIPITEGDVGKDIIDVVLDDYGVTELENGLYLLVYQ